MNVPRFLPGYLIVIVAMALAIEGLLSLEPILTDLINEWSK